MSFVFKSYFYNHWMSNPIEHLWDVVESEICSQPIKKNYRITMIAAWTQISEERFHNTIYINEFSVLNSPHQSLDVESHRAPLGCEGKKDGNPGCVANQSGRIVGCHGPKFKISASITFLYAHQE